MTSLPHAAARDGLCVCCAPLQAQASLATRYARIVDHVTGLIESASSSPLPPAPESLAVAPALVLPSLPCPLAAVTRGWVREQGGQALFDALWDDAGDADADAPAATEADSEPASACVPAMELWHVLARMVNAVAAPALQVVLAAMLDPRPCARPTAAQAAVYAEAAQTYALDAVKGVYDKVCSLVRADAMVLVPASSVAQADGSPVEGDIAPYTSVTCTSPVNLASHSPVPTPAPAPAFPAIVLDSRPEAADPLLHLPLAPAGGRAEAWARARAAELCGLPVGADASRWPVLAALLGWARLRVEAANGETLVWLVKV
jgi:hypothetical protein